MITVTVALTLHDGRVLEIHESAWSKFFDIQLGIKTHVESDDMAHGRIEMSFALPKRAKDGGEPLTPAKGAMIFSERLGRLSLQ